VSDASFSEAAVRLAGWTALTLGWRPDDFWHATPAELLAIAAAMLRRTDAASPPDPATLQALMEAFPDG